MANKIILKMVRQSNIKDYSHAGLDPASPEIPSQAQDDYEIKKIWVTQMFGDLFRQIYRSPLILMRLVLANPMGVFIYGIISKWYIMVMLASVVVTFWVFKGLQKAGVLQAAQNTVAEALFEAQSIAQNCTPLIMDLGATWDCIKNTPSYHEGTDDANLRREVNTIMKRIEPQDPESSDGAGSSSAPQPQYDNSEDGGQ